MCIQDLNLIINLSGLCFFNSNKITDFSQNSKFFIQEHFLDVALVLNKFITSGLTSCDHKKLTAVDKNLIATK